ncbi:MAG: DUF72 domain-containing protein [Thermoplasmataceae archaeon]
MIGRIWIGCSGWVYKDWEGNFYPKGTKDYLEYYSSLFNTVEINSTFYTQIPKSTIQSWIKRTKAREFRFSIKAPSALTHERMLEDPDDAIDEFDDFAELEVKPLKDAQKLGAVLVQLPPFFREREFEKNIETFRHMGQSNLPVFVELRDHYLIQNRSQWLHENGLGIVAVDSPEFPISQDLPVSGYFRLHGRNTRDWKSGNGMEKYRYNYSSHELSSLWDIISRSADVNDQIFIYFNNHPGGNGPRNALALNEISGIGSHQHRIL